MAVRHAIIGSGIAGLSAAEAIRRADPGAAIHIVSEESHNYYSRPGLAYFLRADIPESQLFIRGPKELKALDIRRVDAAVERIECDRRELVMSDGRRLGYDRLLIATGALATPPQFPGGDLAAVAKLDGLDDARRIVRHVKKGDPAVVVGGGITALELAEGLAARGMKVHYFLRGTRYWADVLDEAESAIVMDRLRHEGIAIHTETQVKAAIGEKGRLVAVETQAGQRAPCRVLAVAIGVKPRIDLARAAGLKINKGILVDPRLETSQPGVFAAGDVAEVRDARTGTSHLDVLWPIALAQGAVAGANMAGDRRDYVKAMPHNVTMLAGLRVSIIGAIGGGENRDLVSVSRGESEDWRRATGAACVAAAFGGAASVNRFRLAMGPKALVGALVMGDQTPARMLKRLIVEQVDLSAIRAKVLAGGPEALRELQAAHDRLDAKAGTR